MCDFIKEFEEENYEVVEIFGVPALLFQFRIGNIPDNLFHYDLRGSDYDPGEISTISPTKVCVNFVGTVVLTEKLPITTETKVDINFTDCNAAALIKDGILQYAFNRLYVLNNAANFLCWLKLGTNHYKSYDCDNLLKDGLSDLNAECNLASLFTNMELISKNLENIFSELSKKWKRNTLYNKLESSRSNLFTIISDLEWEYYAPDRQFRNEVEPPRYISKLLDLALELAGSMNPNESAYLITLYDFGDFPINFDTLKDAEDFLSRFDVAPYTLFENIGDDGWKEIYSA